MTSVENRPLHSSGSSQYIGVCVQVHHSLPRHLMEMSGQLNAARKGFRYPLDRRLGGSQSRMDTAEKSKISYCCWKTNPGHPACSPSFYRLSCPGSQTNNNNSVYGRTSWESVSYSASLWDWNVHCRVQISSPWAPLLSHIHLAYAVTPCFL
jgi:hypothetical protein